MSDAQAETRFQQSLALQNAGHDAEALAAYQEALALRPDYLAALFQLGLLLRQLGRHAEALAPFERCAALAPGEPLVYLQRAELHFLLQDYAAALADFDHVLELAHTAAASGRAIPMLDKAAIAFNRGMALENLDRESEALAAYDQAVALAPENAKAWESRGRLLLLNPARRQDAEASFAHALALNPALAGAQAGRGHALIHLRRNREAIAQFHQLEALEPAAAAVGLLGAAQPICDWDTIEAVRPIVARMAASGEAPVTPFQILVSFSDPRLLRDATRFRRAALPPTAPPPPLRPADGKIRLAYLSADYHSHATAHLMADLFERHDRGRFEVIGISFGADTGGAMRQRLERGFDRFLDVRSKSDAEIAALLRQMPVDIAVDLKGYTADARPAIFAHRPAPVQVSYLGYPGMMAADCYDYVLADPVVLPHAEQPFWDERIVHLPDSYQCNDPARAHPAPMSRAEAGLPDNGFVFASFNNHFKIDRPVFESWMRLLAAMPDSLLWLLDDSANDELRAHARARGIDPARLVFAPKLDIASHLRRLPHAELMLDTLPCCAHTTASDALWMGVPMLTCLGQSFAGRVAASLLTAMRCPELIAHNLEDYEALALELARDGEKLAALKDKIAANRLTAPLFDAPRFCRHIERAYMTMMGLARAGVPAKAFDVPVIE